MPHYTKPLPDILDPITAGSVLPKFVWPMVNDQAEVGTPVGGNTNMGVVRISIKTGHRISMTPDQYEIFRTEVLIPIAETYLAQPLASHVQVRAIEAHAKLLIEEAFKDD